MIDAHPSYEVDLALECLIVEQYLACFWLLVGFLILTVFQKFLVRLRSLFSCIILLLFQALYVIHAAERQNLLYHMICTHFIIAKNLSLSAVDLEESVQSTLYRQTLTIHCFVLLPL